jgi:hypothetical protein
LPSTQTPRANIWDTSACWVLRLLETREWWRIDCTGCQNLQWACLGHERYI